MRILEMAVDFLNVQGHSPENGNNSRRSLGRASGGLLLLARPPSAEGRREAAAQSAPGLGQLPLWAPLLQRRPEVEEGGRVSTERVWGGH